MHSVCDIEVQSGLVSACKPISGVVDGVACPVAPTSTQTSLDNFIQWDFTGKGLRMPNRYRNIKGEHIKVI